ncbi:AAA family ATPase [Mammaliicoccus sp. N-M50]|uniref:AAA family ATPase n=1 Tax=Mammaliicoccus sp. N-M50 TaxID=2898709 RepID=UPI001EFAD571|nr:AAA family ATPase [Mammaliicoccus sp. N-M50]
MKLIRLELNNFRQYYGKQTVDFAYEGTRNTTILFGENGKGKTGIYRAIMFVLFGSTKISQDTGNDKIHLTNFKYLNENSSGTGEATVTLRFEHENIVYEISRKISAFKQSPSIITEREKSVSLTQIDPETGNVMPDYLKDKQEISLKINKIMNEKIKDFFLFDAEKIDTLAKFDNKVRSEVKNAIFNLLQIDKINFAKKVLKDESKILNYKLTSSSSDGNVTVLSKKINDIDLEIEELNQTNNKINEEISSIDESIANHNITLDKNKNIIEKRDRIEDKKSVLLTLNQQLESLKSQLFNLSFSSMPYLLARDIFKTNKLFLENFLGDRKISIPREILEKSITDNECIICANNLSDNHTARDHIEILIQEQNNSETYDIARRLLSLIEDKEPQFEDDTKDLESLIKKYKETIEKIDKTNIQIKDLENDIAEQARNTVDLSTIQTMIDQDTNKKIDMTVQLEKNKDKLNNLEMELKEIKDQYQELIDKESKYTIEKQKLKLMYKLEEELKKISDTFSNDVRSLIGTYTTEIFKTLIDPKDINIIDKVTIDKNFEIGAINRNEYKITQDISQGQRQILALSFITALAKIAARENSGEKIDYPLFMDSPFNRLSGMNRDNLIEKIPDLTGQWILLVTDTELTPSEERVFKRTNRLGSWYRINQIDVHHSEIEYVSIDEKMATRGGY